jgi:hypothetical protein
VLDAAETVLGIFGFSREMYGKPKDTKWWIQQASLSLTHKVKRRFLNLKDIEKEDMNELILCEFKGQDF